MSSVGQIDGKIEAEGELYLSKEFWKRLEETFSESPIFDDLEKILQEPEPLDWYSIREFPLDAARDNEMIMGFPEQGGDIILVISYTGKAEIKFDNVNSDSFDLEIYKKIRHTYTDIYLSNTAQSGDTIKILFGRGNWEITDTVAEIDLSGAIRNDQLDQITDPLKIGQIIRDGHIIPHADIACEKILISGATRLDEWRSTDDYTYMDPGRILLSAAATLADWRHPTDLTLINGGQIFTHSIEADKLSILTHILSGATWADASPIPGSISWAGAVVTYNGNTYNITDGNTALAYIWWDFSLSTTTFQTAAAKPALTDDDFIVCYNDAGTHELVWNATLIEGRTIRTGTITADEIMALTITGAEIFGNTITADKLNITDLVDIANLLTVAAGRITIGADVLGAGLHGIKIIDDQPAPISRVEIGHLAAGIANYGLTVRDASGDVTVDLGKLAGETPQKDLVVKNNAANPLFQIDVDATLLKLDDTTKVLLNVNLTIDITAAGANGLDVGVEAPATWYSVWVIHNPATDTVAGLLSISAAAPTMPAGYTKKRRVGWARNDHAVAGGFDIIHHIDDWWWWNDHINVLSIIAAAPPVNWTNVNCTSAAPPTAQLLIVAAQSWDTVGSVAHINLRRAGTAEDGGQGVVARASGTGWTSADMGVSGVIVSCSSTQRIQYKCAAGLWGAYISVLGYYAPISG